MSEIKKLKISLIGEADVGKSSLFYQYDDHTFYDDLLMTTMGDKTITTLNLDNNNIDIEIIDTPGNPRFRSVVSLFINNTNIFLLIFDLTDRNSFEELIKWYEIAVLSSDKEKIFFSIIGNKSDLIEERIISEEEGNEFAKKINGIYLEVTSLEFESVEKVFQTVALTYIKRIKEGKSLNEFDNQLSLNHDENNKFSDKYNGELVNGKKEGKGIMKYRNGDFYDGYWKNDLREGKGTLIKKKGDKYYGIWKNDKLEENVEIKFSNGDEYYGNLKYEKKFGKGKYIYKDLDIIYIGNWENDKKNGFGRLIYKNKVIDLEFDLTKVKEYEIFERYEGNFKDDFFEGEGTFYYKDGKIINGIFKNNEPIQGKINYPNEDIYEGFLSKKGLKQGRGFLYKNENDLQIFKENFNKIKENIFEIFKLNIQNNIFYGNFENDNKHGNGILYKKKMFDNYDNFIIYKGNFTNDLKDKNGIIYFKDKSSLDVEWDNDEIDENKTGVLKLFDSNLEYINQFGLEEWIDFIQKKQKNFYGISKKISHKKVIIR